MDMRTRLFLVASSWMQGLVAVIFLVLSAAPALARDIPQYHGYVNDYADMISAQAEQKLEAMLRSFDRSDSTQIAILTIDSLEGDPLEDFSIRTVDKWQIGQQGKDNGVLLLAVKKERKLRIEVGRGLEWVLTDLLAGRIIDGEMTPLFKTGNFDAGFYAGINAITQATKGEYQPSRTDRRTRHGKGPGIPLDFLFFGLIALHFIGSISRVIGTIAGALGLPLILLLSGILPFSLIPLAMALVFGAAAGLGISAMSRAGRSRRGVFFLGTPGGFGGSSGGFGGGGFGGFGGGGFGGGGASGGW